MSPGGFPILGLALLAMGSAAGLAVWQLRAAQRAAYEVLEPAEQRFCVRQLRRRLQLSLMLGLLAPAVGAGSLISPHDRPAGFLLFWLGVVAWLSWIVLLAIGDAWATRQHLQRAAQREFQRILIERQSFLRTALADEAGLDDASPS